MRSANIVVKKDSEVTSDEWREVGVTWSGISDVMLEMYRCNLRQDNEQATVIIHLTSDEARQIAKELNNEADRADSRRAGRSLRTVITLEQ